MEILKYTNNQWFGMILGGIIGLILVIILTNYYLSSNSYIENFVSINIITLAIVFCIAYLIIFTVEKNSEIFKMTHLLIINSIIGAIFGLFVGSMSIEGEIYWFILGFAVLSLIPIVNMLTVVFWLGTTIYISYYPDFFIPIFNDFLPLHLIDGSMREITSLPLFIFPIFVFLGYLITALIKKSQKNKKTKLSKIAEQKELGNEMKKFESKLKKWVMKGYDTSILEEKQKNCNLTNKIQILKDFELKIQKLKQFETEIQQIDIKEFNYDIISIKKKFKDPYKVDEIESDLSALKTRIKLKIQKLVEKTDNEIKNAIRTATNEGNSQRLNTLKLLQEDLLKNSKNLDSVEISYKESMKKIKEIYKQAVTLNVPPEKKVEKPSINQMEQNYYEIFNIKPNATQGQIKKMFKRLSLAFHPDTEEDTGVDGDHKFRMIMEAYETLKNPDKRKKYDEEIGIKK